MSFNDLERGLGSGPNRDGGRQIGVSALIDDDDKEYRLLSRRISQQVININGNVASINRLIGYLGTRKDTEDTRTKLHDLTEATRDLIKTTTESLKTLTHFPCNDANKTRQRKLEQQKLSKEFQSVMQEFQRAQRVSAEKQRESVDRAKALNIRNDAYLDDEDISPEEQPLMGGDAQRQMQLQALDNEVEYNESLIAERETEIREIEQGITELNEIFRDLGTLVNEQQSMLDNIESNVQNISVNVRSAADELGHASRYQRRARNRMCCILLILVVIACIVSLGVLAGK
ncbi:uncharacterized protein VTP21DRAFT_11099 [Calcarisporiella thermophila]|uniref:uncharacterized protein n=1 Tax=Calcarisporiella thermophila TaxID=911321 RepID=UPI0037443DD1